MILNEYLNQTFDYINIFFIALVLVRVINLTLKHHQQAHYSYKSFLSFFKNFYISINGILLLILLAMSMFLDKWYMMIINSIYLLALDIFYHRIKKILPLKHTPRVLRIIFVNVILEITIGTLFMYFVNLAELMTMLNILIVISPISLCLSSLLLYPLDKLISLYYIYKAKRRVKKDLTKVIGVTGSFGKTTQKDILYELLKRDFEVCKTHKNFNSLMGVTKTINSTFSGEENLILEFGISKKNDMDKLLKVISPEVCVFTSIGSNHLENFNSIEEILNEKVKLSRDAKKIYINNDNIYLKQYFKDYHNVVRVGSSSDCDYIISDVNSKVNHLSFTLKNDISCHNEISYHIESKLNGAFNATQIAIAIALIHEQYHVEIERLVRYCYDLHNSDSRLEVIEKENYTLINDSYNSNLEGFKEAINLLNKFDKHKVLITPGIVGAGAKVNEEIAKYINLNFKNQTVVVIKSDNKNIIYQELLKFNYSNLIKVDNLKQAMHYVSDGVVCLIENDLPDLYYYRLLFLGV